MKKTLMLTIIFSLTTLLHAQTIVNVDEAREAALRFAIKKNLSRSLSSPSINDSVYCPVDENGMGRIPAHIKLRLGDPYRGSSGQNYGAGHSRLGPSAAMD